jgi:hypothetical protein
VAAAVGRATAQEPAVVLRVASLAQWVVDQHGGARGVAGRAEAARQLGRALDAGVQDGPVFWWQRGRIQRQALAGKAVVVLGGEEARGLGARVDARLAALRLPAGAAAWLEAEVAVPGAAPDDAVLLQIGGERHTERQVLESVLAVGEGGVVAELPLAPVALIPGPGIPVARRPFGQPIEAGLPFYRGPGGLELLVVRSQVEAIPNGGRTPNGLADVSPLDSTGDWREADRVLVRLRPGTGRPPALVLGWKDRVLRPDPDVEFPTRASLSPPLGR